jgi:competence protein CoiA
MGLFIPSSYLVIQLAAMLCAKRKLTGEIVTAYFASKTHGPFVCSDCGDPVILKSGKSRVNYFAHENPLACRYAEGESDGHRRCKMEIFLALKKEQNVRNVMLERQLGTNRPDVSAEINGVPVAIEVQISSLSPETIAYRTMEYARKGVYVLWLLQWTPKLDARRYTPRLWEKWIHAAYFGRVYYWTEGLSIVSYHFDPHLKSVPQKSWYSPKGKKITAGGYTRRSKLYRTPIRGRTFNLATDFGPRNRDWWEGENITIPAAKLYVDRQRDSVAAEFYEA